MSKRIGKHIFSDEELSPEKTEQKVSWKESASDTGMSQITNANITLDQTSISIADKDGFKLFQLFPLHLRTHKNFDTDVGAVRIAKQMLGHSNTVCYVSAMSGKYAQNNVIVYNIEANREIKEITTPSRFGHVTNIHLSPNRLAVFTTARLMIFDFPYNPDDIKQLREEDIRSNPKGISAMSYDTATSACYLAYPGFNTGTIQIMNLNTLTARESKSPTVIEAHQNEIAQVALNSQGTLVASGSQQGTVIRVFDARTKAILYELRRGTTKALLQCLAFSSNSNYLAVASDKGTLHLFGIRDAEPQKSMNMLERNRGTGSLLKIMLERNVLALGFSKETNNSFPAVVAVCSDGSYWRFHFSKDGTGKYRHDKPVYDELNNFAADVTFFRKP